MSHPTNLKQRSKKASEAKEQKNSINVIENSDDNDNAFYNETVENNNATGIIKRLQAATKKYDNNTDLEAYNNNLFAQLENNAEGIVKKLQESANKYYWEHDSNKTRSTSYLENSVSKGTPTLHTFWNKEKSVEEADE
ncbi:17285_t:CDS:2, partial [Gigaspora rosea]